MLPEHLIKVFFTNHAMTANMTRNQDKKVTHVTTVHGDLQFPFP